MSDILINYSNDILRGTLEILDASNLKKLVSSGMKVAIKPNLVLAKPSTSGATTHFEIVEGLIRYLKDLGIQSIEIIESSWIGDDTKRAYRVCGYEYLGKKYDVPLFDLKDDYVTKLEGIMVCRKAVETEFLINVPVLKAHCQTLLTCCMKNLKGCIPDKEKRRFHTMGLHRPIALLNKAVKTNFCVVDGICGDLTFEEGGNPVERNMILAGQDPLLIDSYCAGLIGYHVNEIEYLKIAERLGVGRLFAPDSKIVELNKDNKPQFVKSDVGTVRNMAAYVSADKACSACYSALIYAFYKSKSKHRISVGQGYKGKSGKFGCGNCTAGFDKFVPGCPPKAVDIIKFLEER